MIARFVFLALVMLLGQACAHNGRRCADNQADTTTEKINVLLQKTDGNHLSLQDISEDARKELLYRLDNAEGRIDQVDRAMNQGCVALYEDIAGGKLTKIDKERLEKYPGLDWESRNLGFRNWINSIRGALLLQKADNLKAQILLMKLIDAKAFASSIEKKEQTYKSMIDQLAPFAEQKTWAE